MLATTDAGAALALNPNGLERLKLQAKGDPKAAIRAAAQQFEALFLDMMMKSMRDATPEDGLFDNAQTKLYSGMLDSQLAQKLASGRGIGLAEMMAKQLERSLSPVKGQAPDHPIPLQRTNKAADAAPAAAGAITPSLPTDAATAGKAFASPRDFVNTLWPDAAAASRSTGIPAHYLLGHAALESGWGQRTIRGADGSESYNLFGIKAGSSWQGAVVEAPTTEYVNGTPHKVMASFRAYASYAEAFRDYAGILRGNSRYQGLFAEGLDAQGFAVGLQQAGYATDPMYASKLIRILNGTTLRQAMLG